MEQDKDLMNPCLWQLLKKMIILELKSKYEISLRHGGFEKIHEVVKAKGKILMPFGLERHIFTNGLTQSFIHKEYMRDGLVLFLQDRYGFKNYEDFKSHFIDDIKVKQYEGSLKKSRKDYSEVQQQEFDDWAKAKSEELFRESCFEKKSYNHSITKEFFLNRSLDDIQKIKENPHLHYMLPSLQIGIFESLIRGSELDEVTLKKFACFSTCRRCNRDVEILDTISDSLGYIVSNFNTYESIDAVTIKLNYANYLWIQGDNETSLRFATEVYEFLQSLSNESSELLVMDLNRKVLGLLAEFGDKSFLEKRIKIYEETKKSLNLSSSDLISVMKCNVCKYIKIEDLEMAQNWLNECIIIANECFTSIHDKSERMEVDRHENRFNFYQAVILFKKDTENPHIIKNLLFKCLNAQRLDDKTFVNLELSYAYYILSILQKNDKNYLRISLNYLQKSKSKNFCFYDFQKHKNLLMVLLSEEKAQDL